jgi:hypothetical protein
VSSVCFSSFIFSHNHNTVFTWFLWMLVLLSKHPLSLFYSSFFLTFSLLQ